MITMKGKGIFVNSVNLALKVKLIYGFKKMLI